MSRREHWEKPWRLSPPYSHDPSDRLNQAWADRTKNPKRPREGGGFSQGDLIRSSKELIYLHEDGKPEFLHVSMLLDFSTAEVLIGPTFMTVDSDRENILTTIGLAHAYGVPIVPDTEDLLPELAAWEREVFAHGFPMKDEGRDVWVKHSRFAEMDVDGVNALDALNTSEPIVPSEVRVLMATIRQELDARTEAGRVLASLRLGIAELESLLDGAAEREEDLQRCLARHPTLFGVEYARVDPKFRLGGDFEMDFALLHSSGLVDLVEIEASTHPVFNRRGDPSAALVHAEQQVLDWLAWLDQYGELTRRDLPEVQRPVGYVVIGRDERLSEQSRRKLTQRSAVMGASLQVMTWDGLLARAKNLLRHLEGLANAKSG